ncbi:MULTISPECIES: cupin domain-containing protein [Streptomyces]|uniref:Cupin domain-containing protein n=1 Tax=Streptomyces buecherae TaxID=2763006 RepID=A0A7G8KHZ4_9ACTN|nr:MULTISPECIES: cupin domain-containing protein [Streptomyces]MBC3986364.1 cupin domain-containing protein [Streptomyces buecherae]MBC3990484.1 cupin domain-containing protein [Streptomyces buecherae]QKW49714.1 cupin domain-containing protein [Streptomyces buecherae]QNJ42677.1 cupin domain-containing protein [Streptomyces buecherae]WEV28020.1 cupin domain-containing protein [Streptomyces sp. 71268]
MHFFTTRPEDMTFEEKFNVSGRRIFPWEEAVPETPFWGGAWVDVAPGATSTPHNHDEYEMFFITEGTGVLRLGDEERRVSPGDTILMTPFKDHALTNDGDTRLRFVTIWWGSAEAIAAERAKWAAEFGIEDDATGPSQ